MSCLCGRDEPLPRDWNKYEFIVWVIVGLGTVAAILIGDMCGIKI